MLNGLRVREVGGGAPLRVAAADGLTDVVDLVTINDVVANRLRKKTLLPWEVGELGRVLDHFRGLPRRGKSDVLPSGHLPVVLALIIVRPIKIVWLPVLAREVQVADALHRDTLDNKVLSAGHLLRGGLGHVSIIVISVLVSVLIGAPAYLRLNTETIDSGGIYWPAHILFLGDVGCQWSTAESVVFFLDITL